MQIDCPLQKIGAIKRITQMYFDSVIFDIQFFFFFDDDFLFVVVKCINTPSGIIMINNTDSIEIQYTKEEYRNKTRYKVLQH
jgi:hypothetical protein